MSKTALITGATSGFGAAAVRRFAAAGWKVIATGRRAERLAPFVDEFGSEAVHTAAFDIRDGDALNAAIDALPAASPTWTCWSTTPAWPWAPPRPSRPTWPSGSR